ncbi:MAG: flavoprotein [Candidatus Paceibacterota bacterium]|jgi:phosphopantothenoylcysteine synthetase/decarboxylase
MQKNKKDIVLGVTASIAIYKSCDIIRRLGESNFSVTAVLTREARELMNPLIFETLSGNKAYCGMFERSDPWQVEHVALAEKAAMVLIAPATANIIAKIAYGIADDLLTCVVLATRAPVLICPAMSEDMYTNKVTQANIAKLKSLGFRFVEPRRGRLACGREGRGCLAEAETIVREVKKVLSKSAAT